MVVRRRRFKHPDSFTNRLEARAKKLRELAWSLPEGPEKEMLLQKAEQCEAAREMDGWLRSAELRPPN
jgi:hypothetical protein